MSHPEQIKYVTHIRSLLPEFFQKKTVLEVGSLDINGSVRTLFSECVYTGIDVGAGAGVDVVVGGQLAEFPSQHFDVTISCECFEHNPYWLETFCNMIRMTKTGGLVIMTCASIGRAEHGTTRTSPTDSPLTVGEGWEYYRNLTSKDFTRCLDFKGLFTEHAFSYCKRSKDVYFTGIVKRDKNTQPISFELSKRVKELMNAKDMRYAFLCSTASCLARVWLAIAKAPKELKKALRGKKMS